MKFARMLLGLCLLHATACHQRPAAESNTENLPSKAAAPAAASPVTKIARPPAEWTANEVLQQLLTTYREATSYQDHGIVHLSFRQSGQLLADDQPAAVAFERPGKLSVVAYQATVKCDGKELKASIKDEPTNNVDGQIVVRPSSGPVKLEDLARDKLLHDTLSSQLRRQPIQLELLLDAGGLVAAFGSDVACRRLDDSAHAGRTCFRIEVPSPGGPFVFWVDQNDLLLRRLDYPAAGLLPALANDPSVSQIELFADLREASIGRPIPTGQFILDIPPNAKRVKWFTVPPPPLPSELFGQRPQTFFFTRLNGQRLSDKDLDGKIAVLAWYHDHPACQATLQQISTAQERLQGDAEVAFYAVATDPTTSTNDQIVRRLADWKVNLPIVRDLEAFGDKSFHIQNQPTIIVLDKRGRVQIFREGGSPELASDIATIVERLKRGDDLAAEILADYARERQQYEQLLARGGAEPDELLDLPEAVIRRRSEPKKLQIKPLWTNDELQNPGNILLAEAPDQPPHIFAFAGPRSIVEIDSGGKIVARHDLEIPEQAAVTFARTAVARSGQRYFIVSAPIAPQFFVFDEAWKLLLAYPPPDHAPLEIVDLALVDLDANDGEKDGEPEILVASARGAGMVALSLTGEVRWRNRTIPNALSVARTQPDEVGSWGLFIAGEEKGSVLRVNRFGHDDPAVTVPNWPIGRVFGASFSGVNQATLLGLSNNAKLEPFAVGLNDKLAHLWNYPLPPGVHYHPIEFIHSSRVLPGHAGEWWLAGPDGSIHTITADGKLFDSFFYGAPLTGLAATKINKQLVLLVATPEGLAAWEIQLPSQPKSARER